MNEEVKFNLCKLMKQPRYKSVISVIDIIDEVDVEVPIKERFVVETLATVMINFLGKVIKDYEEMISSLVGMVCILIPQRNLT